jgi:hypothetical protein
MRVKWHKIFLTHENNVGGLVKNAPITPYADVLIDWINYLPLREAKLYLNLPERIVWRRAKLTLFWSIRQIGKCRINEGRAYWYTNGRMVNDAPISPFMGCGWENACLNEQLFRAELKNT